MLNWFMGIKQCFDALGAKLAYYMKCRSNCCNNINIYTPKNCAIMGGGVINRFIRTVTPDCVKRNNSSEFYTPKN